jgi:predicted F0F1-ATPase subunit
MRKRYEGKHQGLDNKFELLLSGDARIKKTKPQEHQEQNNRNSTMYYLGFVGELGFAISIPIVLCALLGKYLDDMWKTYPKMTLSLLIVGCVVSIINFVEVIRTILKKSKN